MSKERELLQRLVSAELNDIFDLLVEAQKLLAQPEQEPVNFDLERMKLAVESPVSDVTVEGLIDEVKSNRVFYQEGYAQAELDLKREPLSDLDVFMLYEEAEYIGFLAYRKGIKDAEKAHGIGGEE